MKSVLGLILFGVLIGCSSSPPVDNNDAGISEIPRNHDNTDGGLCCNITYQYPDGPNWMSGFYYCVEDGAPLDPFNPPWMCNTTFEGQCGGDTGKECLTCFDPKCVVGMRCRDADGTGTVIPCK